ncbi:hypothetical protein [[Mycoplasma] anseris]|uniref:Variable surface lipoprotein n=1 Tax=[Mycoplasma] anseris TaxID=92400 RepID=A0A2Z4ND71_9BACT|nr:hypothetical protein [[Mycoplasma] anseris]AWX69523.1 hypothetical protein DP065_02030 [[Mycoplasma] anseris]
MKKIKLLWGIISPSTLLIPLIAANCHGNNEEKNVEFTTKLGLKIANAALNQQKISSATASEEFKTAKDWNSIKTLLNKYQIKYDDKDTPEGVSYSVSSSTHEHLESGVLHLFITRIYNGNEETERFEISGFKTTSVDSKIKIGKYEINSKLKKSNINFTSMLDQLIAAKSESKQSFMNKLKEYVEIKIDDNATDKRELDIDLTHVEIFDYANEIHFEKVYLQNEDGSNKELQSKLKFIK